MRVHALPDPQTRYLPVPEATWFAPECFWARMDSYSTPPPLPIDVLLDNSWVARRAHNGVKGVTVSGSGMKRG